MVDKESSDISNPAKNVPAKLTRTIENLVFEGGGVKGVGYAGAVEVLERYGIVPKRVAGASAGAIAALLLGLGYDSKSLAKLMTTIDLASFQDSPRWTPLGKGIDVYKHYGIYRGDEFETWVKERLKEATGNSDITFRGLQELRLKKNQRAFKDMYFIGANLSTGYYEIFSHEHTADMPIYLAVRISMALPLFFTPKRYGKHDDLYVDGGLLNNYPLTIFDHEGEENLATLGFRLDPSEEISVQRDQKEPTRCKIDSLSSYAKALFAATSNVGNNYSRLQDEYFRTIYIDTKDISTTEFTLSLERQQMLIIDTADHKGETALHRLMANNDDDKKREILTLLLQKGAGLEVHNKFGSTPLHRAAFWGRLATVKALVEAGANRNAKDNEGLTVLEIARQSGRGQCQEIIAYLKQEAEQEQTITQQWAATVKKGPGL